MNTSRDREEQFLALVQAHTGVVERVALLYADTAHEREDLRQEILLQLWRSFPSFRGASAFATWAYRVALNTALLSLRRRGARPAARELTEEERAPEAGPQDPELARLEDCLRRLPELDRAVMLLYLERQPHERIAEMTGLSTKSVGVRVVRIKARLKADLEAARKGQETTT